MELNAKKQQHQVLKLIGCSISNVEFHYSLYFDSHDIYRQICLIHNKLMDFSQQRTEEMLNEIFRFKCH